MGDPVEEESASWYPWLSWMHMAIESTLYLVRNLLCATFMTGDKVRRPTFILTRDDEQDSAQHLKYSDWRK